MNDSSKLTRGQWLVLLAAFLCWMFDGLEMGIFPLVAWTGLAYNFGRILAGVGAW